MSSISSSLGGSSSQLAAIQKQLFSKLDTSGDGKISKDEFVAGRPKGISADKASSLYDKIDISGSDGLTEDQLAQGLAANRPSRGGSSDSAASSTQTNSLIASLLASLQQLTQQITGTDSSSTDNTSTAAVGAGGPPSPSDIFSKIDTNGDGKVTKDEFVTGRPKGVSEDQASTLYDSIDKSGTGSITESQFADAVKGRPAGAPPSGSSSQASNSSEIDKILKELAELFTNASQSSSNASSTDSSNSTNTSSVSSVSSTDTDSTNSSDVNFSQDLLKLLEAIKSYVTTSQSNTGFDKTAAFTSIA